MNQTQGEIKPENTARLSLPRIGVRRAMLISAVLLLSLLLAGGSTLPAEEARLRLLGMTTAGWGFDLLGWEAAAIGEKMGAFFTRPARDLTDEQGAELVREYMQRAQEMRRLEIESNRVASEAGSQMTAEAEELQRQLEAARAVQQANRSTVEQVIQKMIAHELVAEGFSLAGQAAPPVQFTFTEPPKKMVVSPRDRIETVYSRMLAPEIGLDAIERSEEAIYDEHGLSGYITNIGGLGAFPTMVVDRASLPWVLSTVAHEWVHNYLALFPLGWHYFSSPEMTTINETVAEIVGNEIGERALRAHFPEFLPPEEPDEPPAESDEAAESTDASPADDPGSPPDDPPPFDFRTEMRATRLEVDRLLADGQVDEAETYMEQRRQSFVENGYNLRVLNQAYFAFHGSYGTSPSSTSPVGPELEGLRREMVPDLYTFLTTVRSFTTPEDLDAALAEWGQADGSSSGGE